MEPDKESEISRIDLSHTVSVDEAVFQVLGIVIGPAIDETGQEYLPTLDEVLENILETAEADLANAKYDLSILKRKAEATLRSKDRIAELKNAIQKYELDIEKQSKTCDIGKRLYIDIKNEIAKITSGKESILVIDQIETKRLGAPQITKASFQEWQESYSEGAASNHTVIFTGSSPALKIRSQKCLPKGTKWEDLTIKLTGDQIISIHFERRKFSEGAFKLHGLSNPRTDKLNGKGKILKKLCHQEKHLPLRKPTNAQKKTMSELRSLLKDITGLSSDPFFKINPSDGWKPRFKIKSVQLEADNRAKREAVHTEYNDFNDRGYESEDDPADQLLRKIDPNY